MEILNMFSLEGEKAVITGGAGILGSAIGILPTGNTGGSNVSPFKKMNISDDIKKLMK